MSHPRGAHVSVPIERIERLEERFQTAQCRLHTANEDVRIAWMLLENVAYEIAQLRPKTSKPPTIAAQAA